MALGSPPSGENENLSLYKWQEKEVSTTAPGATTKVFAFTAKASRKIKSLTGLHATDLLPATVEEDTTGLYPYYKYSGGWVLSQGNLQMWDCKVYFRKGGVDTLVSGVVTGITSVKEGTTYIEVTFPQNVTAADADSVLLSYAYTDVTNPEPSKFLVKDFDFKYNGRDYTSTACIEGITFKRRQPLELTEISLTTLKVNASLAGTMIGKRTTTTINSVSAKNVTGGNIVHNWAISLYASDPDNLKNKLYIIATNIGATGVNPKGGADSDFEETITFKANPGDCSEIEYTAA